MYALMTLIYMLLVHMCLKSTKDKTPNMIPKLNEGGGQCNFIRMLALGILKQTRQKHCCPPGIEILVHLKTGEFLSTNLLPFY